MQELRQKVEKELRKDILPFWLKYAIDDEYGGFRGQIANDLTIDPHADKGLILNARILWTFSKAFSVYRDPEHLTAARRAYGYLTRSFWDAEYGGVYWMLDYQGKAPRHKKTHLRAGLHRVRAGRVLPRHQRRRGAGQSTAHGRRHRVFQPR